MGEGGALAGDQNATSIPIPGYWIHRDRELPFESPPFPGENHFYHFHGGAYVAETAHPDGVPNLGHVVPLGCSLGCNPWGTSSGGMVGLLASASLWWGILFTRIDS